MEDNINEKEASALKKKELNKGGGESIEKSVYRDDIIKMRLKGNGNYVIAKYLKTRGLKTTPQTLYEWGENFFNKIPPEELEKYKMQIYEEKNEDGAQAREEQIKREGYQKETDRIDVLKKLIRDTDSAIIRLKVQADKHLTDFHDEQALGAHLDRMYRLQEEYQSLIKSDVWKTEKKRVLENLISIVVPFVDVSKKDEFIDRVSKYIISECGEEEVN